MFIKTGSSVALTFEVNNNEFVGDKVKNSSTSSIGKLDTLIEKFTKFKSQNLKDKQLAKSSNSNIAKEYKLLDSKIR